MLDPFREVRTPERNYGPARLASGTVVTPLARRLAGEAGIDLTRIVASGPHGRIVARDVEAGHRVRAKRRRTSRPGAPRAVARSHQGALRRGQLRRGAARFHAAHHRGAARRGQADHSAFLPESRMCSSNGSRRCARRPMPPSLPDARGRARVQALAQRLHHQGAGAGAAAGAGGQCGVGGGPHPAVQVLRHRRRGGDRRRRSSRR